MMKRDTCPRFYSKGWLEVVCLSALVWLGLSAGAWADQVQMRNGDLYSGKVVSLTDDTIVIRSELLGTLSLPREKVTLISLGAVTPPAMPQTNSQSRPQPALTNANADLSGLFRQIGSNSNLIRQVQAQFLAGAGPEANARFSELLAGLSTGKLTVNDLAAQARSAADQMRAARKDLGDEAGWMIDSYLAILDHFVKETGMPSGAITNSTAVPRPKARLEED
jgi:hypothetical protein